MPGIYGGILLNLVAAERHPVPSRVEVTTFLHEVSVVAANKYACLNYRELRPDGVPEGRMHSAEGGDCHCACQEGEGLLVG
jgi:hypothetical protein